MCTEPLRLLIAENTPLLRHLLSAQFEREPDIEVVATADCGHAALDLATAFQPDIALLRLELSGLNGAEVAQKLHEGGMPTRVVLLTAQPQLASLGRLSLADACLSLDTPWLEVLAAVRRPVREDSAKQPAVATPTHGAGEAAPPKRAVPQPSLLDGLSARERAVVEKMVLTEQTMAQIARTLSRETGETYSVSAVKHAMERAMNKLDIEPRTRTALLRRVLGDPNVVQAN